MPQAEGRLPGIAADAEEVEFELGLEVLAARLAAGLEAQTRLLHRNRGLPVGPVEAGVGRNLGGAEGVFPRGIDLVGVIDDVHLTEAVDFPVIDCLAISRAGENHAGGRS
jgi:hypothetical protein